MRNYLINLRFFFQAKLPLLMIFSFIFNPSLHAESPYPIVLVHGLNSSADMWEDSGLINFFVAMGLKQGYRLHFNLTRLETLDQVQTIDQYDSSWPRVANGDIWEIDFDNPQNSNSRNSAIYLQAKALSLALTNIKSLTGKDKVILIGHSMGGLACAAYVAGDPNPENQLNHELYQDDVATLITLGTPFGGAGLAGIGNIFPGIPFGANALRDLGDGVNLFLFGGYEEDVPLIYHADVNCNGQEDPLRIRGLQEWTVGPDWPADINYFWIIGQAWPPCSDCIVTCDNQYLSTVGNSKVIQALHTRACPGETCLETESYQGILEAMDQLDHYSLAAPIKTDATQYHGFFSRLESPGPDKDYFSFPISTKGILSLHFENYSGEEVALNLLDGMGNPLPGSSHLVPELQSGNFDLFFDSPFQTIFLEVVGNATPTNPDLPCEPFPDAHYLFSLQQAQPIHVGLSSDQQTVSLGQPVTVTAALSHPSGASMANIGVLFSTSVPVSFSGCLQSSDHCQVNSDAQGSAAVTFTTNQPGLVRVMVQTEFGGLGYLDISFARGGITAVATPDSVAVNLPSRINITLFDGAMNPVPANTPVVLRTTWPGFFQGNGASSPTSPTTVLTDSNGQTWVNFSSSTIGTAQITLESGDFSPSILPIEIFNPNGNLNLQMAVGLISGDESSSIYEIEASVTNSSGLPVVGQRVDFASSRGAISPDADFTGPSGIADTRLTVSSSGDVTVTATANGIPAATTFLAQVGESNTAPMFPVGSFSFGREIFGVAFSPDGSRLVVSQYKTDRGYINVYNVSTNFIDWTTGWAINGNISYDRTSQVSVSPDGSKLLAVTQDGVDIFNMSNGSLFCHLDNADSRGIIGTFVSNLSFLHTSDNKVFYNSSLCSTPVQRFSLSSGQGLERRAHFDFKAGLGAFCSDSGTVYVVNAQGNLLSQQTLLTSANGYDTQFSTTGSSLAAVGQSSIKIFNTTNWTSTSYSAPEAGPLFGVTFLDNDSKLAVGGTNRVTVIDLISGASCRVGDISGRCFEMAWNPPTQHLAVGSESGTLFIFRPLDPIDDQAPLINLSFPSEGFQTNLSPITLTGRVTDNQAVTSFSINGGSVSLDGDGYFSYSLSLTEGSNIINLSASDLSSNEANLSRTVTLLVDHTGPVISQVQSNPNGGLAGISYTFSANVQDGDTGIASVSLLIRDSSGVQVSDPLAMTANGGDIYQYLYDSTGLFADSYTVDIQAVDSSPQSNSRTLNAAAGFEVFDCVDVPRAIVTGGAQLCVGESTRVQAFLTGRPPWTLTWSDGLQQSGVMSNLVSRTISPGNSTVYSLTAFGDEYCQGVSSGSAEIGIAQLPTALVSGSISICPDESAFIQVDLTGTPPWNLLWSDGFQQDGIASSPATRIVSPSASTTYQVASVADSSCLGSASGWAEITVNSIPSASLSGGARICNGSSSTIQVVLTGTGPWGLAWSDGLMETVSSSPVIRTVWPTSSTTYSLTSMNDIHCNGTISGSATILVDPLPQANLADNLSICPGESTQIRVGLTGAPPWSLTWSDNHSDSGITQPDFMRIVNPSQTTTYWITQVSDLNCMGTSTGSTTVSVESGLIASISPPVAAQGIDFLSFNGLMSCYFGPLTWEWFYLGNSLGVDVNPLTLDFIVSESSQLELVIEDLTTSQMVHSDVFILVPTNMNLDPNGDGCNNIADLWAILDLWLTTDPNDFNGDGEINILDFLYINTQGPFPCP